MDRWGVRRQGQKETNPMANDTMNACPCSPCHADTCGCSEGESTTTSTDARCCCGDACGCGDDCQCPPACGCG
jgi:hypothetical protein